LQGQEKQVRQVEGLKDNQPILMVVALVKKESGAHRSKSKALHAKDLLYYLWRYLL
jgi:hypothetical protein